MIQIDYSVLYLLLYLIMIALLLFPFVDLVHFCRVYQVNNNLK